MPSALSSYLSSALAASALLVTCILTSEVQAATVAKRPNTIIRHTLQFGLTNSVCDSVLSSAQCFETLQLLEPSGRPDFTELSDEKWREAFATINSVMEARVSETKESRRWNAIRKLVLEAYQVNSRYNVASRPVAATPANASSSIPEREPPASALRLSDVHVANVEFVHRLLISGDRLLVDHILIDRTLGSDLGSRILAISVPQALTTEMPASFGASVATAMRALSESAKTKLQRPNF